MTSPKKIPLVEAFGPTIQGEGAVIGQQTYFLRFGLCDYKCTMCDSMHAVDPNQVRQNAKWLTQQEIFNTLNDIWLRGSTRWVTFSGGNPCVHDLGELVFNLRQVPLAPWRIAVETQGTQFQNWLHYTDVITISPKAPGMGEKLELDKLDAFIDYLGPSVARANIKVVIFSAVDLEVAKMLAERYLEVKNLKIPFYLSLGNAWPPGYDSPDPLPPSNLDAEAPTELVERLVTQYKRLFDDIKEDSILSKMRFLPQWHTFVWGNEKGR